MDYLWFMIILVELSREELILSTMLNMTLQLAS